MSKLEAMSKFRLVEPSPTPESAVVDALHMLVFRQQGPGSASVAVAVAVVVGSGNANMAVVSLEHKSFCGRGLGKVCGRGVKDWRASAKNAND